MKASNVISNANFNGLDVMSSNGSHSEILQKLYDRLVFTTGRHSQVFVMALVLYYPSDWHPFPDNYVFSRFLADFIRILSPCDPSYVWVREESPSASERFHYHLALFLNGNVIQNGYGVLKTAQELWAKALRVQDSVGLVHLCQPQSPLAFCGSGFKLLRNSLEFQLVFNDAFHYLSYLAKTATKSPMPGVRAFGCSELF